MALNDVAIVILAAGKGTRLRSNLAKVLHRAGGRSLVEHVVRACQPLQPRLIVAVVGHQAEQVSAALDPLGVVTALQEPQLGTGHAMVVARPALGSRAKVAIVMPGDAPLVRTETLAALAKLHREGKAAATILSAKVADPSGYGRIIRAADGTVSAIAEDSALSPAQRSINEINSSIYAFTLEKLWPCLAQLRPENKHRELYLTDAIALLRQRGETVLASIASDPDEVLGCNTRADLAGADLVFRRRKRAALMAEGVSIEMPDTVRVDLDVVVGPDSIVEPGAHLLGNTRVGTGCTIGTGSILTDAVLGDGVHVKPYSVISESTLDDGVQIGPFAHLRQHAHMMKDARVGNFVEVKKSVLGQGVKSMHLTYLGDANIGEGSNIGAGTITCNYDGVNKHPTTIGRRVFIGSDSALVAPITIGDGAYVGAGSTVTDDVPSDALALARGRQVNKPGWAAARRAEMAAAKALEKPKKPAARAGKPARKR